jgi:hypothetical protein
MAYIQLYNFDKDPLFVELTSGQLSWTLPSRQYLEKVQFVTHFTESDQCYYETVETREVAWELPVDKMSQSAIVAAETVSTMDRKSCESKIKVKYSEENTVAQMNELDMFLEGVDEDHSVGGDDNSLDGKDPMLSMRPSENVAMKSIDSIKKTVLKVSRILLFYSFTISYDSNISAIVWIFDEISNRLWS